MLTCVYCSEIQFSEGKGSEEHVILSSLGGRKSSRNVCCEACNNRLGSEIDQPLANALVSITNALDITTGRNKPSPTLRRAVTYEGKEYDVGPGTKLSLSKQNVLLSEDKETGEVEVSITARDESSAKKLLNQVYSKYGRSIEDFESLPAQRIREPAPPIHYKISLGEPIHFRSIAKMLLTYLATMTNPQRIRGEAFRELADYINGINDGFDEVRYDFVTPLPEEPFLHSINHRIFIFASSKRKIVLGVLELFGELRWSIPLTYSWDGPDLAKAYAINPLSTRSVEEPIEIPSEIFDNLDKRFTSPKQVKTAFEKILQSCLEHQKELEISRISKSAVDKHIRGNIGDTEITIDEEMLANLAQELAEEVLRLKFRTKTVEDIDLKK